MPNKTKASLKVLVETSMAAFPKDAWSGFMDGHPFDPFMSYDFLKSLEDSGSVSASSGWAPCHIAVEGPGGEILAFMPCYLKGHSYGEYVFDHAFAQAYESAGGRYYPKLQTAVPFTPVTGRRVLLAQGAAADEIYPLLFAAAQQLARSNRASSWHMTFPAKSEWDAFGKLGLLQRTDTQYHWHNRGYESFDNFLSELASRKRKTVRKEREQALASDLEIEWLSGKDLTEAHWDAFFGFYMDTGSRKWGSPYLNRKFFSLIGERMAEHVLLVMAKRGGDYIAGALNFIGGDTLYGRYWGCVETHSFLHFEICYYQAIEYAIAHKLPHVEAGAQGEHKIARGYLPETTYSLHYFADQGLRRAVAHYLERERLAIASEQTQLQEMAPYKKSCQ
jgi:uncharacterized protein